MRCWKSENGTVCTGRVRFGGTDNWNIQLILRKDVEKMTHTELLLCWKERVLGDKQDGTERARSNK